MMILMMSRTLMKKPIEIVISLYGTLRITIGWVPTKHHILA